MKDFLTSALMWANAQEFYETAQQTKGDGLLSRVSTPTYYLIAHALELALKAFLRATGSSIEELRKLGRSGHDLVEALKAAESQSLNTFISISDKDREFVRILNEYYSSKELEYSVAGYVRLPSFNLLNGIVEKILNGTKKFCADNMELHYGKPTAFFPSWATKP